MHPSNSASRTPHEAGSPDRLRHLWMPLAWHLGNARHTVGTQQIRIEKKVNDGTLLF